MSGLAATLTPTNYYVGSSILSSCDGYNPCENLQHYVSNQFKYFHNNTNFVFLSGTHSLSESIYLHNVANISFVAPTKGDMNIMCDNYGGLVLQHANKIKLVNITFSHCGQPLPEFLQADRDTPQAAIAFGEVTDLLLLSISVSYSRGYGMLGSCLYGNFSISHSSFSQNKGSSKYAGGNAVIKYRNCVQAEPKCNLLISYSNFTFGEDGNQHECGNNATGLTLILFQSHINALLTHVIMDGNKNNIKCGNGGNLFVHIYNPTLFTSNTVTIAHSSFTSGKSLLGGGIGIVVSMNSTPPVPVGLKSCTSTIEIHNTAVSNNTGMFGVGVYYEFKLFESYNNCPTESSCCPYANFTLWNSTVNGNTILVLMNTSLNYLGNGVAVHMLVKYYRNKRVETTQNHYMTKFENSTFKNNHLLMQASGIKHAKFTSTMITITTVNMDYSLINSDIVDNAATGLGVYKSYIILKGEILIKNNTGRNGGGLMLCESSYIILSKQTRLLFINNHAQQTGGAVYTENNCQYSKPFCFYQLDSKYTWEPSTVSKMIAIAMVNNTAGYAGDHIYGGDLNNCKIYDFNSTEIFESVFKITPKETNSHYSAVSSNPKDMCFCDDDFKPDCAMRVKHVAEPKYPGELISVSIVTVGQMDGTVPGTVSYFTSDRDLITIVTGKNCRNLYIPAISNDTKHGTIELFLSSQLISSSGNITSFSTARLHATIPLKDCPYGFQYNNGNCKCTDILSQNGVQCFIQNHTIKRKASSWIGFTNNSPGMIIYVPVCPYDYCNESTQYIKSNDNMFDQDSQCISNRQGFLCSKCKEGFSLSVGTSDCLKCNTKITAPLILLTQGLSGLILVLLLVSLNMTYTDGAYSGMLFYANVITTNSFIFLPHHKVSILFTAVLSWMSLDVGIRTCFYEGMDTYQKVWISFFFPMYLFTIIAGIALLCKKFRKLSQLFGGNTAKVLATLFQLSYTKLLESVVVVLSFKQIQFSGIGGEKSMIVWLADPTIQYFHGKHIPLALVAIVFGLLILAYTLVLLFIQPLQHYSHLRCFTWVAKLKPLIDAYTAPHIIKDHCRYWEGLLLLFRLILVVTYASNVHSELDINLTAIIAICVLLLTVAWSVGGVYKKIYLNILNSSYIFNTIAVSLAAIYRNKLKLEYSLYTSYTMAILTLILVLAVYIATAVRKFYFKCQRRKYEALPLNGMDDPEIHARQV